MTPTVDRWRGNWRRASAMRPRHRFADRAATDFAPKPRASWCDRGDTGARSATMSAFRRASSTIFSAVASRGHRHAPTCAAGRCRNECAGLQGGDDLPHSNSMLGQAIGGGCALPCARSRAPGSDVGKLAGNVEEKGGASTAARRPVEQVGPSAARMTDRPILGGAAEGIPPSPHVAGRDGPDVPRDAVRVRRRSRRIFVGR